MGSRYPAWMPDDPAEALRARNLRVTPQRRAILGAFTELPEEHLSADEVHARAAARVPEIGRGTVYATLAELTELGLLAAQGTAEPVRYERNTDPHQHFRCRLCLRLFDVDLPRPSTRRVADAGYEVERLSLVAEGVCAQCGEYERGLHAGAETMRRELQLGEDLVATLGCARQEGPLGELIAAGSDEGLVRIAFDDHADFDQLAARARTRRGPRRARERAAHAVEALDAYLDGARDQAGDAVDWSSARDVDPAAVEQTRDIGYGRHLSYERLETPVSAYGRGYAMGANPVPVLLPCHRITRGGVTPTEYVGGVERRQRLHALEASG
jgi:Fe2+ or Zn2+ uptake regulation protein/O6-methylguanine-DNA--protein-cysteine methyltransferase